MTAYRIPEELYPALMVHAPWLPTWIVLDRARPGEQTTLAAIRRLRTELTRALRAELRRGDAA